MHAIFPASCFLLPVCLQPYRKNALPIEQQGERKRQVRRDDFPIDGRCELLRILTHKMFFLFSTNSTWGGASSSSASISYSRSARVKQVTHFLIISRAYHISFSVRYSILGGSSFGLPTASINAVHGASN